MDDKSQQRRVLEPSFEEALLTSGRCVQIGATGCCQNSRLKGKGVAPFNPSSYGLVRRLGSQEGRP
jgi:hypothetical protein